jgi:nitrite reductase/ring-hydroxylating ferredoxin subunit
LKKQTILLNKTSLSKRRFLKIVLAAISQIVTACANRRMEEPKMVNEEKPNPTFRPSTAFVTDIGGKVLIGDDEISLEWNSTDSFPLTLQFSLNGGSTWSDVASIPNNEPYLWTVPQITNDSSLLKLVGQSGETQTTLFKIRSSQIILLSQHPVLEQIGSFKQFEFPNFEFVVVKNTGLGFSCTSLTCTHSGCTTVFSGSEFNCSCHGSRFDEQGNVLNGPANRPLKKYETKYLNSKKKLLIV